MNEVDTGRTANAGLVHERRFGPSKGSEVSRDDVDAVLKNKTCSTSFRGLTGKCLEFRLSALSDTVPCAEIELVHA